MLDELNVGDRRRVVMQAAAFGQYPDMARLGQRDERVQDRVHPTGNVRRGLDWRIEKLLCVRVVEAGHFGDRFLENRRRNYVAGCRVDLPASA
jgi:hypothetical protein